MTGPASQPPDGIPGAGDLAVAIGDVLLARRYLRVHGSAERAAVLILLYDREGEASLVLTKRSEELVHHPGQISLPGGRYDSDDGELATTAVREANEELGVDPGVLRLMGRLDDVPTLAGGFIVTPFVALHTTPFVPVPSEYEIAKVLEVRVADLLAADARLPAHPDLMSLRYPLAGEDVWGATARILRTFCAVTTEALQSVDAAQ